MRLGDTARDAECLFGGRVGVAMYLYSSQVAKLQSAGMGNARVCVGARVTFAC